LGIPAIVYAAQVNSRVLKGDICGARYAAKEAKMWCWIAFGSGLAILLIFVAYSAQKYPEFLRSRIAADHASAIESLQTLNAAAVTYANTYGEGYPPALAALGPPPRGAGADPNASGLIDEVLASGTKHGYVFTYTPGGENAQGIVITYTLRADPISSSTGTNHYFTDQTCVIRQEDDGPANGHSQAVPY
jgi:hypothetical protein